MNTNASTTKPVVIEELSRKCNDEALHPLGRSRCRSGTAGHVLAQSALDLTTPRLRNKWRFCLS